MITPKTISVLCAILITGLEVLALLNGIDGVCLSVAIAAIAGLGGYNVRDLVIRRKS